MRTEKGDEYMDSPNQTKKVAILIIAATLAILLVIGLVSSPGEGAQFFQTSSAVQIPTALVLAFEGLVLAAVTFGFAWLLNAIGLDLTPYAAPLSVTLATFLISLAQNWINLIPAQYDPTVQLILNVLVVVVGGLGVVAVASGRRQSLL